MFIGIQNNNPCFIATIRQDLESLPCIELDEIQEVEFAEMYNGVIYTNINELKLAKQDFIRSVRNKYLVDYVDGVVSNPLRWAEMNQELKDTYISYRAYLLDYTKQENWWEKAPKTLAEFQE